MMEWLAVKPAIQPAETSTQPFSHAIQPGLTAMACWSGGNAIELIVL